MAASNNYSMAIFIFQNCRHADLTHFSLFFRGFYQIFFLIDGEILVFSSLFRWLSAGQSLSEWCLCVEGLPLCIPI